MYVCCHIKAFSVFLLPAMTSMIKPVFVGVHSVIPAWQLQDKFHFKFKFTLINPGLKSKSVF